MKKKKITLITLLLMGIFFSSVSAQDDLVSGTVQDDGGEPLPGVSVLIKGTNTGISTDIDGKYSLRVGDNATLVFSFIGFETYEIAVGNRSIIDVTLEPDLDELDEVVVIGYAKAKKSDITGAVGSIKSEEITRLNPVATAQALQGQAAGVVINKSNGRPGTGFDINIRGLNSIDYTNTPLVIIDGVMDADMNLINPNNIESIDILKDASSTAIYGSRGANGVIIITTKRGKTGAPKVSYNGYVGVKTPANLPDMMNAEQFYQANYIEREALGLNTRDLTTTEEANGQNNSGTDWIDLVTDPGLQTEHTVSVGGGTDFVNYNFSAGYLNEAGNIINTGFERYTLQANMDSKINEKLKTGFTVNYSYAKQELGSRETLRGAYRARPLGTAFFDEVLNPSESNDFDFKGYAVWMGIDDSQVLNPLVEADPDNYQTEDLDYNLNGGGYIEYKPIKGLSIKSRISVRALNSRFGQYRGTITKSQRTNRPPEAFYRTVNLNNYTLDNIVNYKKKFGKHQFNITGLHSAFKTRRERMFMETEGLAYNSLWYGMGNGTVFKDHRTDYQERSLLSYMGRLIYNFDDKYLITITSRWDGASQLSEGNKWDFFPSAAIGWKIDREAFFEPLTDAVSTLKLRVSYGVVGNASVGPYATQARILRTNYAFGDNPAPGFSPLNLTDANLGWEKSEELNFGVDFGFLNDRINGSFEVYQRSTVDLIYDEKVPQSSGFNQATTNIGEVENRGIELLLRSTNIKKGSFSWTTNVNFSKNTNEVISIGSEGITQDIASNLFVGEALGSHYFLEFDGIWQLDQADEAEVYNLEPGDIRVVDQDDNGVIDDADRVILGNSQADWVMGVTNTFNLGNFDFSFLVYTSQGVMFRNNMLRGTMGDIGRGRYNSLNLNYWTPENPSNEYYSVRGRPPFRRAIQYQDASFVKISNITLGYNFKPAVYQKMGMSFLRVYAQAINPFIFHDFDGMTPEYNSGTFNDDVPSAVFSFGVNCTF